MLFPLEVLQKELNEYKTVLDSTIWHNERALFDNYLKSKSAILKSLIFSFFPAGENDTKTPFHNTEVTFDEFRADLVVYNSNSIRLILVEFESAERDSVFVDSGRTRTYKFSTRLVAGLTQLIDWDSRLSRLDQTHDNWRRFTDRDNRKPLKISYMLVIGRDRYVEDGDLVHADLDYRLNSLADRIRLGNGNLIIATYDDIFTKALPLIPNTNLTP